MDNAVTGVWGDSLLGTLELKVPANAPANAHYRVEFTKATGSPDGLWMLPRSTQAGIVGAASLTVSSWGDGIPDVWRLRQFGALGDPRSAADEDPDADGLPNWAEHKGGTDPCDAGSVLRMASRLVWPDGAAGRGRLALRWATIAGKNYQVEATPAMGAIGWSSVGNQVCGNGEEIEFIDATANSGGSRYYRVRLKEVAAEGADGAECGT